MKKSHIKIVVLGNLIEFYDFTLFATLLPVISPLFFPSSDPIISLTSGYAFMAIGFLTRPLGGMIFGYIGDLFGRKKSLIFSLMLMIVPMLTIAIMPTYQQIGIYSYISLAICRAIQGICAGGEYKALSHLLTNGISDNIF